eukprot:s429_g27.t2
MGIGGQVLSSRWLLQEMVTGCYEYSTSLLVCEGEILEVACMRYEYDAEEYVWPRVTELGNELRMPPEDPTEKQLDVMRRLVQGYSGFINFNYKIRPSDGQMCIMEANARIGADLACDVPRPHARRMLQALDHLPLTKKHVQLDRVVAILSMEQSVVNQDRWKLFTEAFGDSSKQSKKGLTRFIKAMHAVIETGEALPITVWKHKKERGLKALTEPLALKLRSVRNGEVQTQKLQVAAEPLVQLADLTRFLTKVTPCVDEAYLQFCHRIIGHRIRDLHSEKEYEVKSFEIYTLGLPIPIHTVMATDGEATESWVLANRAYHILGDLAATNVAQLELKVAFNIIQALSSDYMASLDQLQQRLDGAEAPSGGDPALAAAFASALQLAEANRQEVLDFLTGERGRCAAASGPTIADGSGDGATEAALDPNMRVHTVMIAVSDEIPFELFWPMVKDDIVAAVRELCPRGSPGMEEAVQQGVLQNGMGPIAKKLTLQEAENLATRVGHVVQTGVTVDPEALQEAQKEKANSQQNESIQLSCRVQFNRENTWVPGTVVGQLGDLLSLVDDEGVLFDKLPRARVRLPPGKRDSLGSAGGAPIQAVLSQADLVRIREHLRRRQEEWAERRAQNTGGSGGNGARADEAAAGSEQRTPTSSRPTSAPVPALVHRSRASSAPSIDGAMRRGILLSRDASLSEVDAAGLDVVQFMEDEAHSSPGVSLVMALPTDPCDDGLSALLQRAAAFSRTARTTQQLRQQIRIAKTREKAMSMRLQFQHEKSGRLRCPQGRPVEEIKAIKMQNQKAEGFLVSLKCGTYRPNYSELLKNIDTGAMTQSEREMAEKAKELQDRVRELLQRKERLEAAANAVSDAPATLWDSPSGRTTCDDSNRSSSCSSWIPSA